MDNKYIAVSTYFNENENNEKCICDQGEFCKNDLGFNSGGCEQCSAFSSVDECDTYGLPPLGAKQCKFNCFNSEVNKPNPNNFKMGYCDPEYGKNAVCIKGVENVVIGTVSSTGIEIQYCDPKTNAARVQDG